MYDAFDRWGRRHDRFSGGILTLARWLRRIRRSERTGRADVRAGGRSEPTPTSSASLPLHLRKRRDGDATHRWLSGAASRRIHVDTAIQASFDEVWRCTQTPELHARWDDRFTSIAYAARARDDEPQRFTYERRLLPGLTIGGWGETVGDRRRLYGTATSALRFGSDQWRSLIREGSGFWQYIPTHSGIQFVTEYDYDVRWGAFGRLIDRVAVRPWMAWATARSFERLRRWLEEGIEP